MPPRGQARGGRGRGASATASPSTSTLPSGHTPQSHIETVGVRRKDYGVAGRAVTVFTNHFECKIPEKVISHYDVISPSEKTLPARLNFDIIDKLQTTVAPSDFTPRAVYDGRKNMFAARELPFEKTKEYTVFLNDIRTPDPAKPPKGKDAREPKGYRVRLTKVAEINPEVLSRFLLGKQSNDNTVLTAITALNVVIRMEPSLKYPFNVRSFFTDRETKDIGSGLILWRGYFQSVRPASGRMLINIDISTGTMYKPGALMNLCLEFLNKQGQPLALSPRRGGLPDRERIRLQRFITGIRVITHHRDDRGTTPTPRVIKKLSNAGANDLSFSLREGGSQTVAAYFQATYNRRLQYPDNLCVEVGSGALLPLEVCTVIPGQIMRKQVPPDKTKDVLDFATKKPQDRLSSIINGLPVLAYGQSEYVRQFGLEVDGSGPLQVKARILPAPTLQYGRGSKQVTITPRDGAWNMVDKKFHTPSEVKGWVVVIYEREQRFTKQAAQDMIQGLIRSCQDVGIKGMTPDPIVRWENAQGRIPDQMRSIGAAAKQKLGMNPNLIVVVLPEGATDVYTAIKHFGDITAGVATQCLKSTKCFRAKPQYYANVCLKINVKLGGINTICQPTSVPYLTDSVNPTIVMGADVVHPAPGSDGRPSFTSLVANVDSFTAKYIATSRVQTSRQEMIEDLEDMVQYVLGMYKTYRESIERLSGIPKRIIFYRDGVSEGQFKAVLEQEVPRIKRACEALNIKPLPKLTVIVVGKRHHVRFFPKQNEGDRSGNCQAGTVVDRDVTHPTEFDFYLQSHGGLLGTSRPAHYSVLLDENNFSTDGLQQLSFALCHVYARSTRSVSIPAPVYYADIVCARAKNHYDPQAGMDFSEEVTQMSDRQVVKNLETFKSNFKQLHTITARSMYFS